MAPVIMNSGRTTEFAQLIRKTRGSPRALTGYQQQATEKGRDLNHQASNLTAQQEAETLSTRSPGLKISAQATILISPHFFSGELSYSFVPHSGQNAWLEGFLAPQLLQYISSIVCTSGDFCGSPIIWALLLPGATIG